MDRELKIGSPVIYVDAHRKGHHALATTVWEQMSGGDGRPPGCNLVLVSDDETKTDPYGRQIERFTSVVHLSQQPAGGWCWCWPDEWTGALTEG